MTEVLNIRDLRILPGQAHTEEMDLHLLPYRQAGFDYTPVSGDIKATVDVNAMHQGHSMRLRFKAVLEGPCARCLETARLVVSVDAREIHDPASSDDELKSDFVDDDLVLDVNAWAQEAMGLEFPQRLLCVDDCKGLCPQCGANLNQTTCDCVPETGDSRWDKLKEIDVSELDS